MHVGVVVVTFHSARHLDACLASLPAALHDQAHRTYVVDNASGDGWEAVAAAHGAAAVGLPTNLGFGTAANRGLRAATADGADVLVVLNPDAVPAAGALAHLVGVVRADPGVALASARLLDPDGTGAAAVEDVHTAASATARLLGRGRRAGWAPPAGAGPVDVPWVHGACLALRTTTAAALRGFDERFFLYAEDLDLCVRARRLGRVVVDTDAPVTHVGGASADHAGAPTTAARRAAGLALFLDKHEGTLHRLAYAGAAVPAYAALAAAERATGRPPLHAAMARALLTGPPPAVVTAPFPVAVDGSVALILTVLDEAGTVADLLAAVDAQTRAPDEVVVTDGGSTDGTLAALRTWAGHGPGRTVLHVPGAGISAGRNAAIAATAAAVIAVTDGGARPDPDWLERLLEPLADAAVDVAMGFYQPDARTTFERLTSCLNLPDVEEVRPHRFLPSARSIAYRRTAFDAIGGYPDWLAVGEDMWFDLRMRDLGLTQVFVPDAVVRWRLRPTPAAFARQYFRYARGDGEAAMHPRRHLVRFAVYGSLLAALVARRRLAIVPAALLAWSLRPAVRRARHRVDLAPGAAVPALAALTVLMDGAKMAGYVSGRWRRRRR